MSQVNEYGMTFDEWFAAASSGRGTSRQDRPVGARAAWLRGEDPSDYRAQLQRRLKGRAAGRVQHASEGRERHVPVVFGEVKRLLIKSHGVPRDVAEYLVERYHRRIRDDYVYGGHGPSEIALDVVYEFEHSRPLPAAHAGRTAGSDIDMTPRYAPTRVYIHGHGEVPVIQAVVHPAGSHKGPIVSHMKALELRTSHGSRWYGVEDAYINPQLRMVVVGTNRRDEVRMKWPVVPTKHRLHGRTSGKHPSKKHKPWIQHEGALGGPGYHNKSAVARHRLLAHSIRADGYTTTLRRLLVLTRNHHMHSAARKVITADIRWVKARRTEKSK